MSALLENMSPTSQLLVDVSDGAGTVRFNNPKRRNAMSLDMWRGLVPVMAALESRDDVRLIVLRGVGGRAFCAGADISQFGDQRASKDEVTAYDEHVADAYAAVATATKPTIALVEGSCVGGGMAVAVCADMRIATPDSRFGVPAARLGVGYTARHLKPLVDLVGPSFAKEIMITGRLFDAEEARGMGLVNRIVGRSVIDAYLADYIRIIASNAPLTMRAAKGSIEELVRDRADRDMDRANALVAACYDSADYEEGHTAFMEKRAARFTGR
jgi:enoyl-CoA hydratase